MNIMIIGSGGREHALAWKLSQSHLVDKCFVAPGNAGTALLPKTENVDIAADDFDKLCIFAIHEHVELTVVGPEAPLAAGIVETFDMAGLKCFGPSKAAAQLESSKVFSKLFMRKHNIKTAQFTEFSEIEAAKKFIEHHHMPVVIKADGLAAGKGVIIAQTHHQAEAAIETLMTNHKDQAGAKRIVIEEFVQGEEASFIAIVDGKIALPLATSQDHKARDDGDKGPNTGGMGAYSPAPIVSEALHDKIMNEVINPTVAGMAADGNPFVGFLYAGLMITADNEIIVLEFNVRLGDPETQVILPRCQSDLLDICIKAYQGELEKVKSVEWSAQSCLGVVLASSGYPGAYEKNLPISGLTEKCADNEMIFHAGTAKQDNSIITTGGRVLCICALGDNLEQAKQTAYQRVGHIQWNGMFCRSDIGDKAINR